MDVALEVGTKRTFAGAVEWPGFCRAGRDRVAALEALIAHAPRYARALKGSGVRFVAPRSVEDLRVVERLRGDATTDFGAPGKPVRGDSAPMTARDLARAATVLRACWAAFDGAVATAAGRTLRKGPRGGGRTAAKIVDHILEAEAGYVSALGGRVSTEGAKRDVALGRVRDAALATLEASARGEIPARGPRGGRRWSARFFTRRAAWHVLDHAWEIEDR